MGQTTKQQACGTAPDWPDPFEPEAYTVFVIELGWRVSQVLMAPGTSVTPPWRPYVFLTVTDSVQAMHSIHRLVSRLS